MPNICGTPAGCTGLCTQQVTCPGGGTTSIEGYVTSPNGVLPIPNAVVYVPNGAVAAFTTNVQCETCATASGNPLVTTTTDANGHFLLPNMPVSTPGKVVNIPVVVQLGRWRKQLTIATIGCANNKVPAYGAAVNLTAALPTRKSEGDIPLTAISTGSVDGLECVFRKMGVHDSEFTNGNGNGRIRLYQDNGALISAGSPAASVLYNPPANNATGIVNGATNASPIVIQTSAAHGLATGAIVVINGVNGNGAANGTFLITVVDATHFSLNKSTGSGAYTNTGNWNSSTTAREIDKYDAVLFECVASQVNKGVLPLLNVLGYANRGGRVFATHYSYVWLQTATTWGATATTWAPETTRWNSTTAPGSISAMIDTTYPKGVLFSTWLQAPVGPNSPTWGGPPPYAPVNALHPLGAPQSPPTIVLTEPRKDINPTANFATSGIVAPAQRTIFTTNDHGAACVTGANCKSGTCTALKCVGSVVFSAADPVAQDAPLNYSFNTDTTKPAAQQ